MGAKR